MDTLLQGAGVFIYPLGLCSLLAIFIIVERSFALSRNRVVPQIFADRFLTGEIDGIEVDSRSVAGRIVQFFHNNKPDPARLKAYVQLEVTHMERGFFILEIVIAAAPLLGLLGTVTGLIQVFGNLSSENAGLPDPEVMVEGISLALTTTLIGLSIAIPALVGNAYLGRRVEILVAQINVGVERLIDLVQEG